MGRCGRLPMSLDWENFRGQVYTEILGDRFSSLVFARDGKFCSAKMKNGQSEKNTRRLKMATQKIRIKLRAYDHNLVDESAARIVESAKKAGAKVSGPIPMPTEKEVVTILRSVHKHKDSREQFEMRTHKRVIDIYNPSAKTVDSLMKIDLPAGVDINIKL